MERYITNILLLPLYLQLLGLTFAVLSDRYIRRQHRNVMLTIVALLGCLLVREILDNTLEFFRTVPAARIMSSIVGYSLRPLILLLFIDIVSARRSQWFNWLLVGLNFAVHLTALFSPICFTIGVDNVFRRGPLGYTSHVISALLLFELVYLTVREYGRDKKQNLWIPLFNASTIAASAAADTFSDIDYPIGFLTVSMISSCVFFYIWLHQQFVLRHESDLMAEQRIQIMMTQIQPHFLYNTLSTIQVLCSEDPERAAEITGKFSVYLRQNLNSLEFPGMTSFEKELEHTRTYADIEMIRFPYIHVFYEIEDTDFAIPPLTVQPIVENAIRHGVRIRANGIIRVAEHKTAEGHEIVISDNGVGFDVDSLAADDGSHIGLKNVQERIEKMCGGSVTVDSRIGEGTTVSIRIPDREKEGKA